ncbi:MAG: DPP IV N-terminal domain-containing protein [Acidobacteriota bacterium]
MRFHLPSRLLLALVAALLVFPVFAEADAAPSTVADEPVRLTLDDIFSPAAMMPRGPSSFAWSPDGATLAFRDRDDEGEALWLLDATEGERSALLRPEEDSEGEGGDAGGGHPGGGAGVGTFHWAPDSSWLLLERDDDLHRLDRASGEVTALTDNELEENDPKISPDGQHIGFVRDDDLWVLEVASGDETRLTFDGRHNRILNGTTDWVYWEELWGRAGTGFWWAPEGDRIAFYRFDEEGVPTYPLIDFQGTYPVIEHQKYPKAGQTNPRVRVGVVEVDSGELLWLSTGDDDREYLARVHWRPDGEAIAVHRINRDQNRLDILLCGTDDGACETVYTETAETWVYIEEKFQFLSDGGFVRDSEQDGWRHLYRHGADGAMTAQLTDGDWAVSSVESIDEGRGEVVFTAFGEGPMGAKDRRVMAVALDGASAPRALTEGAGWHRARVAPKTGHWVHEHSRANDAGGRVVKTADGRQIADLSSQPPALDPAGLPKWEFLTIPGPEGSNLPARLMLPAGVEPGDEGTKRHPVIMYHYGGPASQVVRDAWSVRDGWSRMMATRGFGVLMVDNQASVFFGKTGADRVHRRFGPTNLAAQEAAVAWLKEQSWADAERIGLWGWSGGGSNTLYCLFNSPRTWKAGVAGAPVTRWDLYDTIWTERYLDHPESNEEGYRLSSPVTHAENLDSALLVIHGVADDNVHPQNTLVLANALIQAGKPFEQGIYPGQKHGFRGKSARHFYDHMTRFFERELSNR